MATGIGNWQHFHIGNISLRVIILTQRRRAAESGTAPPGSAGILPAAFVRGLEARAPRLCAAGDRPSRLDQRRGATQLATGIGNWQHFHIGNIYPKNAVDTNRLSHTEARRHRD